MRRITPLLLLFVVALFAGACSSDDSGSGSGGGALTSIKLPATEHIQVATGESVQLDEVAGGAPTLAWFWAPH